MDGWSVNLLGSGSPQKYLTIGFPNNKAGYLKPHFMRWGGWYIRGGDQPYLGVEWEFLFLFLKRIQTCGKRCVFYCFLGGFGLKVGLELARQPTPTLNAGASEIRVQVAGLIKGNPMVQYKP